jgi:hypothetical protein
MRMDVEHWWNVTDRGQVKYLNKNPFQSQILKSNISSTVVRRSALNRTVNALRLGYETVS